VAVPAFISGWLPPAPVSTFGARIDQMYYFILWITGIIFVLTESALIYFSIRYRRQDGKKAYYTHGNTRIEIIWTTIPALILLYMGFASQNLWSELRQPTKFPQDALVIKVQAEQWLWHFKYAGPDGVFGTADDITVDNAFHIPIGQPVRFEVTSQDVIHGFYLPDFRVHQDAVPGLTSLVWLQATQLGTYDVRCTQFCGTNHYQMKGQITVDTPEDYKAWLANSKAAAF
jgi:cytochrome c oxidase subunit 2